MKTYFLQYLKSMQLLYMAFMFAQMIFIGIIFILVNEEDSYIDLQQRNIILFSLPLAILILMTLARKNYQQQLKKIRQYADLKEMLSKYRVSMILYFAESEVLALGCFLGAFLSQNLIFVYGSIGVLLFAFPMRPSRSKLIKELNLDFNQQEDLSN